MDKKLVWELITLNGTILKKEIVFKEIVFKKENILIKCDGYSTTRDYTWLVEFKAKII